MIVCSTLLYYTVLHCNIGTISLVLSASPNTTPHYITKVVFAGSKQEVQVLVAASHLAVERLDFDTAIRMLGEMHLIALDCI